MPTNQHIIDYLSFYAGFPQPPGYAVMLNGRWGTGKTFLLKEFLNRIKTSDFKPVYVSLNGLTSSGEIDKALFKSMHAVLGNKFFGAAVGLGKSGLKALKGVSIDVDLLDLVNRYTADLYVFDDLERCEMKIGEILGYINAFVEHGGRKVVIRRDLDASTYFVVVAQEPPWRTVWYGLERSDVEVAAAQVQMEAAFAARAYTVPGEILHVFGLRLQLSQIGALSIAVQNVVMECERYVDDLYARKQLEPATVDDGSSELRATGYGGLGIVLHGTRQSGGGRCEVVD